MARFDWMFFFKIIFSLLFVLMSIIGILALLEGDPNNAVSCVRGEYWLISTTGDMYITFFVFYLWVFYKETKLTSKVAWLFLIFLTGAISVCLYILIQLFRLKYGESFQDLLLKRN